MARWLALALVLAIAGFNWWLAGWTWAVFALGTATVGYVVGRTTRR
jgi:hypothetical protein